ncbi:MAG TPA: MerR family transcriptional regulator, partial [Vineibacter sp.]|nr:MerR family transcriptional regulator [Vineibacter sp.]
MSREPTATAESRRPAAMIGAFCTIGEAAYLVEVPPHVLRFWESRLSHIQPHKRGRWRYYRARDIELLRRVRRLLHDEGFTLNGVQRLL